MTALDVPVLLRHVPLFTTFAVDDWYTVQNASPSLVPCTSTRPWFVNTAEPFKQSPPVGANTNEPCTANEPSTDALQTPFGTVSVDPDGTVTRPEISPLLNTVFGANVTAPATVPPAIASCPAPLMDVPAANV